ncbi:MAG TPA: LLM class flavin-dependent oxidoreductase [Phototrophicaceae bacterium]|nr:LLM class flavin-dependent oxidoreductase [Phototrophicaceae bacterium]
MKFIFGAEPEAPISAYINLVKTGESLGYDAAWVPDQTFYLDPFVSLALCAAATDHIELVIGVANPYTRHPVQVARALGTLDDAAPGRVALGYGAGNRRQLVVPLGGELERPAAHVRAAVKICRALFRGETLHYRNDLFVAEGVQLQMPAHPNVPIYVAARGPRILEVAGELADAVVIGAITSPGGIEYALRHLRIGAERAGRDWHAIGRMLWITCHVTEDKALWIERYRPNAAHILAGAPPEIFDALKLTAQFMVKLKARYAEGGSARAAYLVPDDLVLQLAAIGSADEIADQLQRAADCGIDQIGILVNAPTIEESHQSIRRFAEEVMPKLK